MTSIIGWQYTLGSGEEMRGGKYTVVREPRDTPMVVIVENEAGQTFTVDRALVESVAEPWMHLEDAIKLLCGVHLRAMEFDDWEVEMGALPVVPWDCDNYVQAWGMLRQHVLKGRKGRDG